jgi:hypothetical protein
LWVVKFLHMKDLMLINPKMQKTENQ